jgi:hypothetical protein
MRVSREINPLAMALPQPAGHSRGGLTSAAGNVKTRRTGRSRAACPEGTRFDNSVAKRQSLVMGIRQAQFGYGLTHALVSNDRL